MADSDNQYQRGPRDRTLRAADDDREAVAGILREQHLAGRLDTDEFQERVDRCYGARTYAELDQLVADLPAAQRAASTPSSGRSWRRPAIALLPLLIAIVALSNGHLLWLALPLLFFGVRPLLWRSAGRRFGPGFAGCRTPSGASSGTYV
jgi:Domain of unknown function (DUF1707)